MQLILKHRLHEQCLQIVHNNKNSNFNWLVKDGSVCIHHQNLRNLAVEMIKVSRSLSPEILNEVFQFREQIPHELRQRPQFQFIGLIQFLVVRKVLNLLGRRYGHWCLMK